MAHRIALLLLAVATGAALLAFCAGLPALAVAAGALYPVSLILLGATRGGRARRLAVPILILGMLLAVGLILALYLPESGPEVLGLPLGTAVLIFGVIPVPLLLTGLAYALSFDRSGLRAEDLEKVRAAKREA